MTLAEKKPKLYPLKFQPIFKEKVWGGTRISKAFKEVELENRKIGELFCLSGLDAETSIVANGPLAGKTINELLEIYKKELVGEKVYAQHQTNFPLLIKIIDAAEDLSVQVHPNDAMAKEKHNESGKNEMWYVIDADQEAHLVAGFKQSFSSKQIMDSIADGTLLSQLNKVKTHQDDVFYIPAGKIHSIGKGNLIAEVQQCSDLTYRVYDFERKDQNGKQRELHLEEAVEALDFKDVSDGKINHTPSKDSFFKADCFTVNLLKESSCFTRDYSNLNSFVLLLNLGGEIKVFIDEESMILSTFAVLLLPASSQALKIEEKNTIKVLEVIVG